MVTTAMPSDAAIARAQSAAYGLIAHGLRYPDRALARLLANPAHWSDWPATMKGMDAKTGERLVRVRSELRRVAQGMEAGESQGLGALQDAYAALFGHAVRGQCPPYELEYGSSEIMQRASELADLSGFYAAWGLEIVARDGDRPDHAMVECEFMGVLCAKEAYASDQGEGDLVDAARHTQRQFLKDHLGRWFPAFARRVEKADSGFYNALVGFAGAFIDSECRRHELLVGPALLELRPIDPDQEMTISCGGTDLCAPGAGEELTQLNIESSRVPVS